MHRLESTIIPKAFTALYVPTGASAGVGLVLLSPEHVPTETSAVMQIITAADFTILADLNQSLPANRLLTELLQPHVAAQVTPFIQQPPLLTEDARVRVELQHILASGAQLHLYLPDPHTGVHNHRVQVTVTTRAHVTITHPSGSGARAAGFTDDEPFYTDIAPDSLRQTWQGTLELLQGPLAGLLEDLLTLHREAHSHARVALLRQRTAALDSISQKFKDEARREQIRT